MQRTIQAPTMWLLICALCATSAFASSTRIGGAIPAASPPGGVAFIGPNQLVVEIGQQFETISLTDASITPLATVTGPTPTRGLAYRESTGELFDSRRTGNDVFYRPSLTTGSATPVNASHALGFYNFLDLAVGPNGQLWLGTDTYQGIAGERFAAYRVDTTDGTATLAAVSAPVSNRQLTNIGISRMGDIYTSTTRYSSDSDLDAAVYRFDVATSEMIKMTTLNLPVGSYLRSLDENPADGAWYGIEATASNTYFLRRITGIPEPTAALALLTFAGTIIHRR